MTKEKLEHIAYLTDQNAHGIARIEIAMQYPYLKKYENILQHINNIHKIEGSMPYDLINYRSKLTEKMLEEIEKHEGYDIAHSIAKAI